MRIPLREILNSNVELYAKENLYYQKHLSNSDIFEKLYLELRKTEGRLYSDKVVKKFPEISSNHIHQKEWAIRKTSMDQLISYLRGNTHLNRMLEVGCGNGWLSNNLARAVPIEICGIDINETELKQASRLFHSDRLSFINANIMESIFPVKTFDVIIMASSIQYFPSLNLILKKLQELLTSSGEIHILDSPLSYSIIEANENQKRSNCYFESLGLPEMSNYYFYHTINEFAGFNYTLMYNPKSLLTFFRNRISRKHMSPFPWFKIANTRNSKSLITPNQL